MHEYIYIYTYIDMHKYTYVCKFMYIRVYIHTCMHIYIDIRLTRHPLPLPQVRAEETRRRGEGAGAEAPGSGRREPLTELKVRAGLYTILRCTILYGVWHTKDGSAGGRRLRNGRAIHLQYGRLHR